MAIVKWALVALGCLTLTVIGMGGYGFHFAQSAPAVQMSLADLRIGGSVPAGEHEAFISACQSALSKKLGTEAACACAANQAEHTLSRFARLNIIAGMSWDVTRGIGLLKGMEEAGVKKEEIDAALPDVEATIKAWQMQCAKP
jgi:hypothetical protein